MSYFGSALEELLNRKNMRAARLAELTGIAKATISRYVNGEQTFVSGDDLASLCKTISDDPAERAELIRAHLLDECQGPGAELIDISIKGNRLQDRTATYDVKLPAELEVALTTIRQRVVHDKDLRDIVEGLGNLFRHGDVRTTEERGGKSSSAKKAAEQFLREVPLEAPPGSSPSRKK